MQAIVFTAAILLSGEAIPVDFYAGIFWMPETAAYLFDYSLSSPWERKKGSVLSRKFHS